MRNIVEVRVYNNYFVFWRASLKTQINFFEIKTKMRCKLIYIYIHTYISRNYSRNCLFLHNLRDVVLDVRDIFSELHETSYLQVATVASHILERHNMLLDENVEKLNVYKQIV